MSTLVSALHTLQQSPVTWCALIVITFVFGIGVYQKSGKNPLFAPLIISTLLMIAIVRLTATSYQTFMSGGHFIHFLLGPATVALAVPLYEQRERLRRLWLPITCGILSGSFVAIVSTVAIAYFLGASKSTILSLAPKSVTVPIAMGVSDNIGGIAELTAALVVVTGAVGSILCQTIFRVMRSKSAAVNGVAVGLAAHGFGTATAFQISRDTGAFSGLSMALTGLVTAFMAPLLVPALIALLQIH